MQDRPEGQAPRFLRTMRRYLLLLHLHTNFTQQLMVPKRCSSFPHLRRRLARQRSTLRPQHTPSHPPPLSSARALSQRHLACSRGVTAMPAFLPKRPMHAGCRRSCSTPICRRFDSAGTPHRASAFACAWVRLAHGKKPLPHARPCAAWRCRPRCSSNSHHHSTVTLLARLRGLSTSVPSAQAVW